MKKAGTLIGIVLGIAAIFGAFIWEGGNADTLFLLPPMLIVFGGTLAAGLAGSSINQMSKLPQLIKKAFFPKKYDVIKLIDQIVEYGALSRKDGVLALENKIDDAKHPYLKKMLEMCVDGTDPDVIEEVVHNEMYHISERHEENINLFTKLGGYSPTMGIIGTVMGLIATLSAAGQDPVVLIQHIASAFIATMWGIVMANIFWLPIGDKLRRLHNQEMRLYDIMLEGVKALQLGETPTVVLAKLSTSLPSEQQKVLLKGRNITFAGTTGKKKKSNSDEEQKENNNQENRSGNHKNGSTEHKNSNHKNGNSDIESNDKNISMSINDIDIPTEPFVEHIPKKKKSKSRKRDIYGSIREDIY